MSVHAAPLYEASDILRRGFTEWSSAIFAGFPLIGDVQVGLFYPIWFLLALIGRITPWHVLMVQMLHLILAGIGAALFARSLTNSKYVAIFCGLAWQLSGVLINHTSHVGIFIVTALIPWLLLTSTWAARKPSVERASILGLILGVTALVGHVQTFLYAAVVTVLWYLFRAKPKWHLLITFIITVGVSTAAWLLTLPLVAESERPLLTYAVLSTNHLEWRTLITLLLPNYFGAMTGNEYFGQYDITQGNLGLGAITLGFAMIGLFSKKFRKEVWFSVVIGVLALLYALGNFPVISTVAASLPIINKLRGPIHASFIFCFSILTLAAIGLEFIFSHLEEKRRSVFAFGIVLLLLLELLPLQARNKTAFAREGNSLTYPSTIQTTNPKPLPIKADWRTLAAPGSNPNQSFFNAIPSAQGYNPLAPLEFQRALASPTNDLLNELGIGKNSQSLVSFFGGEATVELIAYNNGRAEFNINSKTPGILVFRERYAQGWRASIDSERTPILKWHRFFQVIYIDRPLQGRVAFTYHQPYFPLAPLVSLGTALLTILIALRPKFLPRKP